MTDFAWKRCPVRAIGQCLSTLRPVMLRGPFESRRHGGQRSAQSTDTRRLGGASKARSSDRAHHARARIRVLASTVRRADRPGSRNFTALRAPYRASAAFGSVSTIRRTAALVRDHLVNFRTTPRATRLVESLDPSARGRPPKLLCDNRAKFGSPHRSDFARIRNHSRAFRSPHRADLPQRSSLPAARTTSPSAA